MRSAGVAPRHGHQRQRFWVAGLAIVILLLVSGVYAARGARHASVSQTLQHGTAYDGDCSAYISKPQAQDCSSLHRATMKVPEPTPLWLVGTGLLSIAALIRNRTVSLRKRAPRH